MPPLVSIQVVAERTGLTAHTIRAWERRYGAIEPSRSPGRHRMYSEEEIYRLQLLSLAASSGRLISRLAGLDNIQLRNLVETDRSARSAPFIEKNNSAGSQQAGAHFRFLDRVIAAVKKLDPCHLSETYEDAHLTLGSAALLKNVIAPLASVIGEHRRRSEITLAQEHFFAVISKSFLYNIYRSLKLETSAPKIVVATPLGQMNDTGACILATVAAMNGWKACLLGANLPASELVGAIASSGACALALSIVHPEHDSRLISDLIELGEALPRHIKFFVGGPAAHSYMAALRLSGAKVLIALDDLGFELDALCRNTVQS